jgi:hypothetical protein
VKDNINCCGAVEKLYQREIDVETAKKREQAGFRVDRPTLV